MERQASPERLCRVLVAPPGWNRSPDCLSLRTMGTRPKRGPDWLRSDRTENVAAVIMVTFFTAVLVWVLVDATQALHYSGAWPAMLAALAADLVVGIGLAALLPRWRSRWMRDLRSRARGQHWGVAGMFLPFGLMFVVGGAPAFAEAYACEQGDGIVVTTSWTHTSPEGVKSGVYTYGGETYDIAVSGSFWLVRQAGPEQPPTDANPYYTRTYRVPWAGSSKVCGNEESSDAGDMIAIAVVGGLGAGLALASGRELLRRRRRSDELPLPQQSHPA